MTAPAPMTPATPTEATLHLLVDELREGVALLDVDDLSVCYANAALLRILGRDAAEVRGVPLVDFVDAADVDETLELARTAAAGRIEIDLRARDGGRTPVALSVARFDGPAGPMLAASAFNLSGQHEQMRQQRERLERIGRRKDEFIAMLGHELRNPLAPLRHAAELLEAAASGAPGPSPAELTQIIHRQVDHMARLVSDLLDIGRTTTGRLPVRPRTMRFAEVVVASVESVALQVERRGHTMRCMCDDVTDVELDADPVRLTQMLTNLLSNAVKYTPNGGHITLECRLEGRVLVIHVHDDGIGIAADELESIFEPFYQSGPSLDRTLGGLGIGLALVRGIAELHGGSVRATSQGTGGSSFEVRIPGARRVARRPSAEVAMVEPSPPPGLRVLVIDDNEDAARMLALLLERRGCRVDVGFLGGEGLALVQANTYDVAFVDIGLPDLDGYAFAARVAPTSACPRQLVALTGYGQPEDRARALAAGFHEHVVKPLSPRRLDELLSMSPRTTA